MRAPSTRRQRLHVESIEPRILYSADPASALLHTAVGIGPPEQFIMGELARQPVDTSTVAATVTETHHELAFIDGRVTDQQQLIDDIRRAHGNDDVDIVVLDPTRDGIEQISERLAQEHGLDAMHIISHAEPGVVQIGATKLDFATMLNDATAISRWRSALNDGADLLLYGCDLAATDDGRSLVDALSRLTGADVAASTDVTGGASVGGDWVLEYATGLIQSDALASASDLAAWNEGLGLTPAGSDILVNSTITTGAQVTNSGGINVNPVRATAIDGSGNFVVVWDDPANSGDVYARRFNAAGTALGAQFRVNTTTSATQDGVTVAMNSSGAFVVVWENNSGGANGDGSGYGIFAQRYDASGVAQGSNFQINKTTANDQTDPSVAMDNSGNFVVSWTSVGPDSGTTKGVYARRFDASGTALDSGDLLVNTTTAGDQQYSNVSCDANGNFVVAWSSADSNGTGVYARLFNSAGVAQSAEISVNLNTTDTQDKPSVSMNATGEFVVAWESNLQDGGGWGSYARLYNAAGVAQSGEISLNSTIASDQDFPVVAMDSHGNFLASWESNGQDGNSWGVYSRLFDRNGTAVTGETLINSTTSGTQEFPSVAWNGTQAVYVWDGNGPGDSTGIFFRTANASIPGVTVTPTSGLTTTEAGGTATFNVVLISAPTANVTISIASSNAVEGTVSTSSLTFTAANWNVAQTVTVTGVNDAVDDGDIAYSIVTDAAVSADPGYNGMNPTDVAVTNVDNDTAGVTVSPISGDTTEAGGIATFSVVLTSQPTADVTIGLASSNPDQGTASTSTLTFTAANWNVAQLVTVTGHGDSHDDGDVSYKIVTQPVQSLDPTYQGRDPADVALVNKGIDAAPVITARSVLVEQGGTLAFRGDNAINVADASGNLAMVQISTTQGTLDLSLAGGASLSAGARGSPSLTLTGSQAQIQAALATLTYRGAATFHGNDALVIVAADRSGQVDRVVVTVAVAAPNNALNQPDLGSEIETFGSPTSAQPQPLPPAIEGAAPIGVVLAPLAPAAPRAPSTPADEQATSVVLARSMVAARAITDVVPHSTTEDDSVPHEIDIRRLLVKLAELDAGNGSGHADEDLSIALAWSPDDDASAITHGLMSTGVLLETVGLALSVGGVWWALRVGGLLTSLLASMPAWRQVDLLPVLPDEDGQPGDWEAEDDEAALEEEAMAHALSAKKGGAR